MSFSQIMSKYGQQPKHTFVKVNGVQNQASLYSSTLLAKSNYDLVNNDLSGCNNIDIVKGCVYLPNFICKKEDLKLFNDIKAELGLVMETNLVQWSKHYKFENPEFSDTFGKLIKKIGEHFNMEVLCTRLNYYKDGTDWKPYHHDSHAFSNGKKENFTVGISLGSSRELSFMHVKTGKKFSFPQSNGDVFAFDDVINRDFMHGVPKAGKSVGERVSIIAWGIREV